MRIAVIGLGRMGANISRRLMRGGHQVVAFDRNQDAVRDLEGEGATSAASLADAVAELEAPRIFWVMLPAGGPTEDTITALRAVAQPGDIVIDGGNTFYKDDIRRYRECAEHGIHYVDVGTSGGVWGLERGYCLMIGGDKPVVDMLDPIFDTLAPGYGTISRTPGRTGRTRLPSCRACRRRPLREDGAQRHRIWPDAGLCRGLRRPEGPRLGQASGGPALHDQPS